MEPDLDHAHAHTQQFRDLRRRKPMRLIEQNHGAVAVGQVVKASLHTDACFSPLHSLVRGRFQGGRLPLLRLFAAVEHDLAVRVSAIDPHRRG